MITLLVAEQALEKARKALHPRGMTGCVDPDSPPEIDYVNTHRFVATALRAIASVAGGVALVTLLVGLVG